jgi:hypothetical protein
MQHTSGKQLKTLLLFISFVLFSNFVYSNETKAQLLESPKLDSFQDWVLDEKNGLIYFLSSSNELIAISTDDLQTTNRINIGFNAVDLELYNGSLYIGYSDKQLKVVNTVLMTITKEYQLSESPEDIAVNEGKVFYLAGEYNWKSLYEFDLQENMDKKLNVEWRTFYQSSLEMDPINNVLYIGESGLSGSHIYAFDTLTYKMISRSAYDNGYGFYSPAAKVVVDGEYVYYAGRRLDKENLAVIHGDYGSTVHYANGKYVFTEKALYERDTFTPASLITGKNVLMDSAESLYSYDNNQRKIKKVKLNVTFDHTTETAAAEKSLRIAAELSDWVYDEDNNKIYAISKNKNRLYYINASTFDVENEVSIGSQPVDIEMNNGTLYVALMGATKIAVANTVYDHKVEELIINENPYRIAVSDSHVFYTGEDQWQSVDAYDLRTGSNTVIRSSVYEPSVALSDDKKRLIIAEANSSGSNVFIYNTSDLTLLQESNYDDGYGFSYLKRYLSIDKNRVYAGKWQLSTNNINQVHGVLNEVIIYANHGLAFSNQALYDGDELTSIGDFPYDITLAAVGSNGQTFTYDASAQTIYQYDSIYDLVPLNLESYLEEVLPSEKLFDYYPVDTEDHWAYNELDDFVNADLLKGYKDEEGYVFLKPNKTITRAEFVTILVRALGLQSSLSPNPFKDVNKNDWFYDPVQIASSLNIVSGMSENTFEPNRNIRRDEAAAIIVRAFQQSIDFSGKVKNFSDVPDYWAKDVINKASKAGIIGGVTETMFKPFANATRAQSVVMLHRALHLETSKLPDDQTLKDVVLGFENKMIEAYQTKDFHDDLTILSQYKTGFELEWNLYNIDFLKVLQENGIDYSAALTGNLSAAVIYKSNRFAAVELSGAVYDIRYQKNAFYDESTQDTSGIVYLKKIPDDGSWKIYQVYLPDLYSSSSFDFKK